MHIYVSADFYAKSYPDRHIGLCREHWKFGKTSPVEISELCEAITVRLLEFHLNTVATGDPVELIGQVIARLEKTRTEIVEANK